MSTGPFFDSRIIDDDILVVVIRGGLDSTTTPEFDREIQKHLDEGRSKIIIDCRFLDYLSTIAIGRLVVLQKQVRSRGGEVKLTTLLGAAAEVIEQVGLGNLLNIYPDQEFARRSFLEEEAPQRQPLRKRLAWAIPVILALSVVVVVVGRLTWFAHPDSKAESADGQFDSLEAGPLSGSEDSPGGNLDETIVEEVVMGDGPADLNRPPLANDDAYETASDTQLVVSAPGILENDTDSNLGDALSVSIVDTTGTWGTIDYWNGDGSFAYTPRAGYRGGDTFRYSVTDGELNSSPATVTITISEQPVTR